MDPHAFFRRAEAEYFADPQSASDFKPRTCDFIVFKYAETSSDILTEQGTLEGEGDVFCFLNAERDSNVNQEVRIIFTPARQAEDALNLEHLGTAIPFHQNVFRYMVDRFHFHKNCFEKRKHEDIGKIVVGNVTSFFLSSWRHLKGNNMKVFISSDARTHVTTIFAHDGLPQELNYIHERLQEACLVPLSMHPLLLLVFIMETMVKFEVSRVEVYYREAISRLPPFADGGPIPFREVNFELDSRGALFLSHKCDYSSLCLEILQSVLVTLVVWSMECDSTFMTEKQKLAFEEASKIICHRLENLVSTVKGADRLLRTTKAYNEVFRQSLDVKVAEMGNQLNLRIAAQSRDIALDSRRDSSAMKAIAVLTIFFLPGTFVAACFAMPLFNWDAPSSSLVLHSRFWIYPCITIPITAVVLCIWRVWYRFEEWRQWHGRGEGKDRSSFLELMREMWEWFRAGGRPMQQMKIGDENTGGRDDLQGFRRGVVRTASEAL